MSGVASCSVVDGDFFFLFVWSYVCVCMFTDLFYLSALVNKVFLLSLNSTLQVRERARPFFTFFFCPMATIFAKWRNSLQFDLL